jgi:nitroimidazol reductase NimA-like FMN-containing flavoprotein (pyridoxamine 5'-phosphate oxidase superfamily)/GNAT superfamily N-acetyltransferase
MDRFSQTDRTTLKRLPKRGVFERESVYAILDEAFICHVGFVTNNGPVVIPTGYGRSGDDLFIHGSAASRMLRTLATSVEVCVTITILDGLVLARSAFHHSMNYRSVVIFGAASPVEDIDEKLQALRVISDNIIPERWEDVREPNDQELRKTLVLRLPLREASAKIRRGSPLDDEPDYELPIWAGEIPLRLVALSAVPDPRLPTTIDVPHYVETYTKARNGEVHVRRAEPGDASAIAATLEESFIEYRELYTPEGYAATVIPADKVRVRMSEGAMWVAVENAQIVGTVAAVSKGEALHVRGMGIVPAARGKRIGRLLLEQVESFARTHHHAKMTLNTTLFLCRAIALYRRFGFETGDEATADLFGTPLFTMVKTL